MPSSSRLDPSVRSAVRCRGSRPGPRSKSSTVGPIMRVSSVQPGAVGTNVPSGTSTSRSAVSTPPSTVGRVCRSRRSAIALLATCSSRQPVDDRRCFATLGHAVVRPPSHPARPRERVGAPVPPGRPRKARVGSMWFLRPRRELVGPMPAPTTALASATGGHAGSLHSRPRGGQSRSVAGRRRGHSPGRTTTDRSRPPS